jgi:predicted membrane-bound spermidine synthase
LERIFLLFVFFASGFAAVLYQTIWQRLLTLFGGADLQSITIIVSAFMAGLGFGNLTGGHLADRLSARQRVLLFAACEMGIALFAAFSSWIYYDLLYVHLGEWHLPVAGVAAIVFGVTLWPTFLMGMSLPLVSRILTTDPAHPARWVPLLYGWNTLGAACGSFAAVAVLFPSVDFPTGLKLGAVVSASCAIAALALIGKLAAGGGHLPAPTGDGPGPVLPTAARAAGIGFGGWLAIYTLSGFIALSLEMVWFRMIGVMLKSNAFTFGRLLAVFLFGVGLGSALANSRGIRDWRPTRAFFLLQAAVPMLAALSVGVLTAIVGNFRPLDPIWAHMGSYEVITGMDRPGLFIGIHLLAVVLILPSTTLMGLSFGFLQRAVQHDLGTLGRRVGWLQTANIVGSMLGALLTGLLLLDWLGSPATLRLLALLGSVFLALSVRSENSLRFRSIALAGVAASIVVAVAIPPAQTFWSRLHGTNAVNVTYGEDGSGLAVLKSVNGGRRVNVFANGLGQSQLPYGGIHTVLGALPALLHPNPESIAVIGLGSGDTVFAAGGRTATRRLDSIEIIAPELDVLQALNRGSHYPGLRQLLEDPRVHHHFTDGRTFVRRHAPYDIIEADALRPTSAYSGNLYSVEYFTLLRSRLKPGGLGVSWVPTVRVRNSMLVAFPYLLVFKAIAVGSSTPIEFDRDAFLRRMADPETRRYYQAAGITLETLFADYLAAPPESYSRESDRSRVVEINRDLFPRDEFGIPLQTPGSR